MTTNTTQAQLSDLLTALMFAHDLGDFHAVVRLSTQLAELSRQLCTPPRRDLVARTRLTLS